MCVIMLVKDDKLRPTETMIEKAAEYNDDGIGAAWREGEGKDRVVVWKKGLENTDLEEVKHMAKTLPVPYVLHFRAVSVGDVCKQLTHPFPVDVKCPLALTGRTSGHVLFHNGTWDDWRKELLAGLRSGGLKLPAGSKWSDTRAIATLSGLYGEWFLELIADTQKGIVFGPRDYELFAGKTGWVKVQELWCSNNDFMIKKRGANGVSYYTGASAWDRQCAYGPCQRYDVDKDGYCPAHTGGKLATDLVTTGTGGSRSGSSLPFPQDLIISQEMAERLHHVKDFKSGQRQVSRGMLKEIKAQHKRLKDQDPKVSAKGKRALIRLTEKLMAADPFLKNLLTYPHLSGLAH